MKFIKQKDEELAKALKAEKEAKEAFDKVDKSINAVDLNASNPTPTQDMLRVLYMDAYKRHRDAINATIKIRTERYTALKQLKAKVGIVRVRELGIND